MMGFRLLTFPDGIELIYEVMLLDKKVILQFVVSRHLANTNDFVTEPLNSPLMNEIRFFVSVRYVDSPGCRQQSFT